MATQHEKKKIAIVLGGTHDHITLLEKLSSKGYYTILIDYNDNPPGRIHADEYIKESTLNKEKVLEIASVRGAALVIATCIDQALLTMAFVSEELGLPCHLSYHQALSLTNKAYMKKVFFDNGIPTSKYVILEEQYNIDDILTGTTYPSVVKPSDSNSSKGIKRVDNEEELATAVQEAFTFSRSKKVVVEDFVEGIELSVDVAIIDKQAHVIMVTENIKNSNNKDNFTIIQNTFKKKLLDRYSGALKSIAENIARAFNIDNGPLLIQLLANNDSLSVIEFSSRIGGGSKHFFINKMSGFDMLNFFLDVITGGKSDINTAYLYEYGSMNYIYAHLGTIREFRGFTDIIDKRIAELFFFYKTEGMEIYNNISSADRPAGYMVVGDDAVSINKKMEEADATLQILDTKGKDIMLHGLHQKIEEVSY